MKERASNNISSEMLAAFIDGEADAVESRLIVDALSNDAALREVLKISAMVDEQMERFSTPSVETLPMMALAASSVGCTVPVFEFSRQRYMHEPRIGFRSRWFLQ